MGCSDGTSHIGWFILFLRNLLGDDFLFFFDAVSPIVTFESIDMEHAFWGDRFGKGKDYINCPLTDGEYEELWKALVEAEVIEMEDFDRKLLFERCQPIEEIARSGKDVEIRPFETNRSGGSKNG